MKYLSVKETASLWKVNERRVRALLDEGRIDGAMKVGKSWMIPNDAAKPLDARIAPSLPRRRI
jgi:excisionase family DNA binding protein